MFAFNAPLAMDLSGERPRDSIDEASLGCDFGLVTLQAYTTTEVVEDNYGDLATRSWLRMIVPLWTPSAAPATPLITKAWVIRSSRMPGHVTSGHIGRSGGPSPVKRSDGIYGQLRHEVDGFAIRGWFGSPVDASTFPPRGGADQPGFIVLPVFGPPPALLAVAAVVPPDQLNTLGPFLPFSNINHRTPNACAW